MPDTFLKQMGRTHHTLPMMDRRSTDERSIARYGGIGIRSGFHVAAQAAPDRTVKVSRGILVDPNGKEFSVAVDSTRGSQDALKALNADFYTVNVAALLGNSVYDAIDPATHSILLTVDSATEMFKVHKITAAEKAAIVAGVVDLTSVTAGLAYFEAATGDHAARLRVSRLDPDALCGSATKVATEFIVAILDKDVAGASGVINSVTLEREKDVWANFSGLP